MLRVYFFPVLYCIQTLQLTVRSNNSLHHFYPCRLSMHNDSMLYTRSSLFQSATNVFPVRLGHPGGPLHCQHCKANPNKTPVDINATHFLPSLHAFLLLTVE